MTEPRASFAIMGSGGVGGYFGARLARAGYPVAFIARGAHLQAIRDGGIVVEESGEAFTVEARASDSPAEIGPVDYVLFAVKLWDTETAGLACRALVGPHTAVVTLQNGVDSSGVLATVLGEAHVMGGVAEISALIAGPGRIRKLSPFHRIRFGELDRRRSARAERFGRCLLDAGIEGDASPDIVAAIWAKFVFLTGLSALTALTRKPIGAVREDADTRALLEQVMREAYAVGQARGVDLGAGLVAERLAFVDTLPGDMRASMAADLDAGRRLELPWLSGAVVRLGAECGVPTPANAFVHTALKLHAGGADPPPAT